MTGSRVKIRKKIHEGETSIGGAKSYLEPEVEVEAIELLKLRNLCGGIGRLRSAMLFAKGDLDTGSPDDWPKAI